MLEVVEVVGWDGAVVIEGLVLLRADDQFHGDGGQAAEADEIQLQVAELAAAGGEPGEGGVRAGAQRVKPHMVEEVPQADHQKPKTWRHMTNHSPHDCDTLDDSTVAEDEVRAARHR